MYNASLNLFENVYLIMNELTKLSVDECDSRSSCPLTNTLDLIGDKWTLLVIRDMLFIGKKQFGDFLESPEGISTNILADRLKRLEMHNIIDKRQYQENPVRYEYFLTATGQELKPILMAIAEWGMTHIEGTAGPTKEELEAMRKHYAGEK